MTPKPYLLSLAAGLLLLTSACDSGESAAEALPPAKGEQAPARAEMPTMAASAGAGAVETRNHRWVGSVQAKHHVELSPQMTGVIAQLTVEEGETVEKGQILFRTEGAAVKLAVSQASAAVAQAQLSVDEAEREAERTRKLASRGSVGSANLERAESGVKAAKAGLKQAKAAAAVARAQARDLTVKAPISGVIVGKYKNVGELATMMPPTIVLIIDDLSTVEVRVRVPELKLREIDVGSPVSVYFPALDLDREVSITRIGNAVDPRSRTIELVLEIDNPGMRIKSGMSVEVGLGKVAKAEAAPGQEQDQAGAPAEDGPAKADADATAKADGGAAKADAATPTAMLAPGKASHSAP
ncbi:efflux transporter, RND family, MFP subunit [Plesiocystis pacifica SIR-1]|uniref:Efflux transporter, RND family, MFP subunit n=1 Tax=Plesiocystis pacifica SIR-1 TaxID=391625 RepID=A6GEX1_9BACT|nr:efflux RND transporter periplasmic adaptor subunit [Plesiocystis pacifica]EDM75563.1 efflux transporter, RND family, MFP subunit [Plesiocystis pacifica SIR-1]